MKKVTIMIPTYNQPQYIEQCIDSVLKQSYPNLEIIISDDSTNNETEKIIKEKYLCDKRIKYFHNIPSLGRVKNYHKTLYERATGDYVLNLDGDDWLIDNNYIKDAVSILENNQNVCCVLANKKVFLENENKFKREDKYNNTLRPIMSGKEYLWRYAFEKVSFSHLTALYKRDLAIKIGFYNKDFIFSDGESFFRLFGFYDVAFINREVGVWRVHNKNESHKFFNNFNLDNVFELEKSLYDFFKRNNIKFIYRTDLDNFILQMKFKRILPILYSNFLLKSFILLSRLSLYDKRLFNKIIKYIYIYLINKKKDNL